jgi:hypothetical protein
MDMSLRSEPAVGRASNCGVSVTAEPGWPGMKLLQLEVQPVVERSTGIRESVSEAWIANDPQNYSPALERGLLPPSRFRTQCQVASSALFLSEVDLAIRRIWLQQPIAFARAGGSDIPVSAFRWTLPDLRPRGSARTGIFPQTSFEVDPETATLKTSNEAFVLFKDENGIRPVCPFFELHGDWDGRQGGDARLTETVLRQNGLALGDIEWSIRHANHKAYAATHEEGDRIEATLAFRGDDHSLHALAGYSPQGVKRPLVLPGSKGIAMGQLRAIRPSADHPEIRLRFTAPKGLAYGPIDLAARVKFSPKSRNVIGWILDWLFLRFKANDEWKGFALPKEQLVLSPEAAWMNYKLMRYGELPGAIGRIVVHLKSAIALLRAWGTQQSEFLRFALGPRADVAKLPPGLYASWRGAGAVISSLGLVDDLGDGVITCALKGVGRASARIVVGPPHFSPDRRPPVSIADDLTDKESRAAPRDPGWATGANAEAADLEIQDLLDRAFETAGASNLDAWAEQRRQENQSAAVYRGDEPKAIPADPSAPIWGDLASASVSDLPLFEQGRWRHRRNSAEEFFEQLVRDNEGLVKQWIRDQDARSVYYDKRMPALMRGSDRRPLHLTRRQYEAFTRWFEATRARKLRENEAELAAARARKAGEA